MRVWQVSINGELGPEPWCEGCKEPAYGFPVTIPITMIGGKLWHRDCAWEAGRAGAAITALVKKHGGLPPPEEMARINDYQPKTMWFIQGGNDALERSES